LDETDGVTALWDLDGENISVARKLPPVSTRNWSMAGVRFDEIVATKQPVDTQFPAAAVGEANRKSQIANRKSQISNIGIAAYVHLCIRAQSGSQRTAADLHPKFHN
jgi:hypothetical protein